MSDAYPPYIPDQPNETPKKNLWIIIILLVVFLCLGCLAFLVLFYFVLGDMLLKALGLVGLPLLFLV